MRRTQPSCTAVVRLADGLGDPVRTIAATYDSSSAIGRDTRLDQRRAACDETGRAATITLMRRGATAPAAGPNRVRATAVPPAASATRTGPRGLQS